MLVVTATVLTGLIGAAVILMGIRAFWAPQGAAGFGIPDTPTDNSAFQAWLTVKAVRDIACGALIFVVLAHGAPELLGWAMLVFTGVPIGDAVIVYRSKGPKAAAYGIHGVTALVMLAVSVLLFLA